MIRIVIEVILGLQSIGFFISGVLLKRKASKIVVTKNNEEEKIRTQIIEKEKVYNQIISLIDQQQEYLNNLNKLKESAQNEYEKSKQDIQEQLKIYKDNSSYAAEQYIATLNKQCELAKQKYDSDLITIENTKKSLQDEIQHLKDSLSAGVQAQLREKEKEEKEEFFKIQISQNDIDDIEVLEKIRNKLHQPVVLSKLIWSTFFQKKTTEMCDRVFGVNVVCGIYKITNTLTKQCYIGQSVDVSKRMKEHVKCGLGIEASATNKLYNAMQEDGVWNFTFELIESCSQSQLNEKEHFWITTYQSDKFGYNSNAGISKKG